MLLSCRSQDLFMASRKRQKRMVFHRDGVTSPAAAPKANAPLVVALKTTKAISGDMERGPCMTSVKASMVGQDSVHPTSKGFWMPGQPPAKKDPPSSNRHSDNLSPVSVCKGIKVTLDNNNMWNEFYRCRTEMILTKQGSRMFPYCRFHISGLQPSKKYALIMDIIRVDNSQYKWNGKSWQVAGKAVGELKSQLFAHPDSPSTGQHWMQNPVSFYKLKLTSNMSDQDGNFVLHPMSRYMPRLHVVQTDRAAKDTKLSGPDVATFTFLQTEFIAVTTYQNSQFSQLKVDYNPFAKGLREDGSSSWGLKPKSCNSNDLLKNGEATSKEPHPVRKSLKSLLANHKPRGLKALDPKPALPGDVQRNQPTDEDQSAAAATRETSGTSCAAKKLFSELIREAHVSLQRCNLERLAVSHRHEQSNVAVEGGGRGVPMGGRMSQAPLGTLAAEEGGAAATTKEVQEARHHLNSPCSETVDTNCSSSVRRHSAVTDFAAESLSKNVSVDPDDKRKSTPQSDVGVKQHKRPAPLPLPALALFLKQHSTKSKRSKSRAEGPPLDLPPTSMPEPPSCAAPFLSLPSVDCCAPNHPKDPSGDIPEPKAADQAFSSTGAARHPDDIFLNVPEQAVRTVQPPSGTSGKDSVATDLMEPRTDDDVAESSYPPAVLPSSDQTCCTLGTMSLSLTTSSTGPVSSPTFDSALPPLSAHQTSSTRSSDSRCDTPLPDPVCSPFGFEPLSPASSPEPLPSLPASLAFDLDSTPSEAPPKGLPPEELQLSQDSVFKWHTVLPLPEPYADTFPAPQTPHSAPQTLDPDPSFPDTEQSLPFPAELSPLALQLTLSPSFSSLDADGLSPTPSLADLVHLFSTEEDLGMGVEFTNADAVAPPCPLSAAVEANDHPQQVQSAPPSKPCQRKRRSHKQNRTSVDVDQKMTDSTYTSMQPNLEEVEEQLFISFTSKEALKLHVADSSEGARSVAQPQTLPAPAVNSDLRQSPEEHSNVSETANRHDETIEAFEKILLRDLKLMKHRQIIHPVLQEVGLKMYLLDPSLSIDLQYLGVRLPIPPPGTSLDPPAQGLLPSRVVSAAFVSRTGKTTDVTQIKGWREKFAPLERPLSPTSASRPEAAASCDQPRKNLSAFCSDMLDEYLENEGKLIDQRADTFSQAPAEPPAYELPARSCSYVRTLDSILRKPTDGSPASDLISGFVPPSRRPKPPLREAKGPKKGDRKQRVVKQNKPVPSPAEPTPAVLSLPVSCSEQPGPDPVPAPVLAPGRRWRRKSQPSLGAAGTGRPAADMAPLESDSELDHVDASGAGRPPVMTRALLKQRDLEDGVMWEGRPRTCVTEERAAIALTSLFTLKGFVSDNPTAPIQLPRRRAPPCLNDFCRLGCVCSSLDRSSRISHCGRTRCMFGCSCLKQKVVLLKNLDGSDSSPSHRDRPHRRRKRRMKMAYVLKEADSVSQPAERVRTLWDRHGRDPDPDPDPTQVPDPSSASRSRVRVRRLVPSRVRKRNHSCARVRCFQGKTLQTPEVIGGRLTEEELRTSADTLKKPEEAPVSRKRRLKGGEKTRCAPPPGPGRRSFPASRQHAPDASETPAAEAKASKRLVMVAECEWKSEADRSYMLKTLCEAMSHRRMDKPFWVRNYLVSPMSRTVERSGAHRYVQFKVHVTRPIIEVTDEEQRLAPAQVEGAEPFQVLEEELVEDPQPGEEQEVRQVHDGNQRRRQEVTWSRKRRSDSPALPFLTGISPAGFLSANKKQPSGTDQLIQVNGKLYPLAKIQLGEMGALHPANRLAAYLTGRVRSNRKHQGSAASSEPAPTSATSVPSGSSPSPSDPAVCLSAAPSVRKLSLPATTTGPVLCGGSQLMMIRVPGPVSVLAQLGASAPPAAPPGGQKVVLQAASGMRFYRKPDGKLVQLIPISNVRPVQTGPAPPPAPRPPSVRQMPPAAIVSTVGSGCMKHNGPGFMKVLPPPPSKDLAVVSSPNAPPPPPAWGAGPSSFMLLHPPQPVTVKLTSLKASACQEKNAEAVSEEPRTTVGTTGSEVTPVGAEPARDVMDLDIVCVEDETSAGNEGGSGRVIDVVDLLDSSSGETDDSSDFDSADEGPQDASVSTRSLRERERRAKMLQLLEDLQREVGVSSKTSKVSTLNKAVEVIQELRTTEKHLKKRKSQVKRRRMEILDGIVHTADEHRQETGERTSSEASVRPESRCTQVMNLLEDPADHDAGVQVVETLEVDRYTSPEESSVSGAFEALSAVLNTRDPSHLSLLIQARQEIRFLQGQMKKLEHLKRGLTRQRDVLVSDVSRQSGKSESRILRRLQHLTSNQNVLENDRRLHPANQSAAAGGGASVPPDTADGVRIVPRKPPLPSQPPSQIGMQSLAPPTSAPAALQQLKGLVQVAPSLSRGAPVAAERQRTVPSILSRPRTAGNSAGVQGPVPAELLSLVGAALPGKQVMTLSPLMVGQTVVPLPRAGHQPPPEGRLLPATQLIVSTQTSESLGFPPSTKDSADILEAGSRTAVRQQAMGDEETLTSLLDQIDFLNQQPEEDPPEGQAHWLPDPSGLEGEGLKGQSEMTGDSLNQGSPLAPPPLLQMKMGGAKGADPAYSNMDGGQQSECARRWRPMPRLVPLGLRGAPPL